MKSRRPYSMPKPLTCEAREIANGVSMELVKKYIRYHQSSMRRYNYLENLYKGFHDIYNAPEKEDWKPDNRLAVNFPRYMTETFSGYGYGVPIQEISPDDSVNEAVQDFMRGNEINDHESEMVKKCCIFGHAFEYLYQDEETKTKISAFSPQELFVVYDDTLKNKALFAVRYGQHVRNNGTLGDIYGEILTPERIEHFDGGRKTEIIDNPYGYIPCVEWKLNEERIGLYEEVAGLVEAYNFTIGEKANDVQAFAEAYLAILGTPATDEQVQRIRDDRVINFFGTDDPKDILVQFLSKPTADGTQENLLNRLEDHIYETSMVANISDDTFGNATSGTALAYKLQAMSNLALTFDRKIEKSLRKRYKIWSALGTNTSDPEAYRDMQFIFTRNLPKNIAEEIQAATQLEGVVSKETQLSVMPSVVPDPQIEIEKIEDEKEPAVVDNMFGDTEEVIINEE